jgi:hypothetical protein
MFLATYFDLISAYGSLDEVTIQNKLIGRRFLRTVESI